VRLQLLVLILVLHSSVDATSGAERGMWGWCWGDVCFPIAQVAALLSLPTAAGMASLVSKSFGLSIPDCAAYNAHLKYIDGLGVTVSSCERMDFL